MTHTITGPSGRTYKMVGPEGDHQVRHWRRGVFYEAGPTGVLQWAYNNPRYFERVVDIGASLGNHSVFFAGELGSIVVSVEPHTHGYVQDNMTRNRLASTVVPFVVGPPGKYQAVPGPVGNVGMTRFEKADTGIRSMTLKRLCRDFIPTAIKVDAEGSDVFWGSYNFVRHHKPLLIVEESEHIPKLEDALALTHKRLDSTFNATPTFIYVPL